jgi:hypothetical protein
MQSGSTQQIKRDGRTPSKKQHQPHMEGIGSIQKELKQIFNI